ncbi:MAG: nitroreductase family protein [Pseudomonadales bacterium]|nr:nitroreductase family protein [Pseudomonadales bacterium]
MELREAIGRRRSIRFVKTYKPVEPEKIQRMFEAARIASHWGNVQTLKAVAVFRDTASPEVLDAITATVVGWQVKIAPVVIVWYIDPNMLDEQSDRLRELLDIGALGFGDRETKVNGLEKQLIPLFRNLIEPMKNPGMSEVDCGQGIAQATLMAYEQGLGTCCLGTPNGPQILKILGVPEHCRVLLLQTVGYPLEHWEAGGQRPRRPFGDLFKMNHFSQPFPRDEAAVAELTRDGMFTRPAPLPEREAELDFLQKALNLKAPGLL